MASRYGVPAGSSLADWPIGYDEFEPWYARAERELGVAGGPGPLPPLERRPVGDWLAAGAAARGWTTFSPPLAVNSVPYNGRDACIRCSECLGFTCPTDAKNGSHNTYVPRALATGLCTLETGADATTASPPDGRGRVTGVEYAVAGRAARRAARADGRRRRRARSRRRACCCSRRRGTIRTGSATTPTTSGATCRGTRTRSRVGILPPDVPNPNRGPGVTVATTEFSHGNPGVVGGGDAGEQLRADPGHVLAHATAARRPALGRREQAGDARPLPARRRRAGAGAGDPDAGEPRHAPPTAARSRPARPVAEARGLVHPETARTAAFVRERLVEWLEASGAERVVGDPGVRRAASPTGSTRRGRAA